jgi:hypothetical protein
MQTTIRRPAALLDALNPLATTAAAFSFATVYAKNAFQAPEPPRRVAKIGRRMQTAF